MKKIAVLVMLCMGLLVWSARDVPAQDYAQLFRDFDPRGLTYTERRFLQAALAFEGHYVGLLDGDWGRLSQRAMEDYARAEFGTDSAEWHMAMLALSFLDTWEKNGWDMQFFDELGLSVMLPLETLVIDPPSAHFLNYRQAGSSLSISVGRHSDQTVNQLHRYTLDAHAGASDPYALRKTNYAVTSATMARGGRLYTRSHFIRGQWSTIMVSAERRDRNAFSAVTSSIAVGQSASLDIATDGKLLDTLRKTFDFAARDPATRPDQSGAADAPTPVGDASGSGFFVTPEGHVLTNAHVVSGCAAVFVDGARAEVTGLSEGFDLALLKTAFPDDKAVAVFSASPARLNSDVTVAGYPYADLLGGLNITRGAVSSLKGLRGDATQLQITAPVQSGNSGGPLLGADGEVLGVVVAQLDALAMAQSGGSLPQNVNFAITGEIAKLFLSQNNVSPKLSLDDTRLAPEDLAQVATGFTSLIECRNPATR